tara:strand:+ start:890 stop:1237 length:348 start_codon:yes stop_codon:yes gene_type:complete
MTGKKTMNILEIVEKINKYAIHNYENGWDIWIETLNPEDKIKIFEGSEEFDKCFKKAQAWVSDGCEVQAIQAENCALYDTGEQEATNRYSRYQENAELQKNNSLKKDDWIYDESY